MASNTGTTLPGGYRNSLGGPADEWYAQANGTEYASITEACAAVPQAYRRNRTVIVAGQEYWWKQADLSDNGLIVKNAPSGPGGSGSPAIYADFIFTAENDGPQTFPLPAGTLGLVGVPSWFQPDTGQAPDLANYDFIDGNLVVYAATDVKAGDKFFGQRYYGGAPGAGAGGGPVQASDIQGVLEPDQIPPLTSDDIADLSDLIDQYKAAKGPLILNAMPLLQTPLNGALEFDGATLYFTKNGVRASIG